ncbi:MAG: glycosyl hydrolase-related protein [Blautia marasmi]
MRTGFHVDKWCECDLMEEPESPFTSSEIRVSLHPYEIKTLLLCVKDGQKMESGDLTT